MSEIQRIVVFTADLSQSVRKGIIEIDCAMTAVQWMIVIHRPRRSLGGLLRSQRLNLRRNGWRWIPYQVGDILSRLGSRLFQRGDTADAVSPETSPRPGDDYSLSALMRHPRIRIVHPGDIHGPESLDAVGRFQADLGLSLAAPILKRDLFGLPRLGTINLHKGQLPEFRGMPPAFWEFWFDASSVGCTVHQIDERLDTGAVFAQKRLDRERYADVRGMRLRLDEAGIRLMRDVVLDLHEGRACAIPQQAHNGQTHRKPTLAQVKLMRRKLLSLAPPQGSGLKRQVKEAVLACLWLLHRHVLWRFSAPRITVLLYHRVSDDARDNLTVGIAQFERQMALLSRHCDVLSLQQVLDAGTLAQSPRPRVAVTFDDGYQDNYTHAAPILERHRIPCAFFVSTGIVNSDRRFPHDVRRGNPVIPVMSWDQLRDLRARHFEIGSHSVSHIDCAAEPESVVTDELTRSVQDLVRELNEPILAFAYPYGGRQHMTPARLERVKQAGYTACLSAFGGSNVRRVDRFQVLRRGIHWEYSDRAFLFECLGR